ncbi:MAG: class I SAM-dependent methyltransferase [Candidatus Thorarchaeota archaeon]|nr:class I SAM-dependent methyltransferase [Candidatus Thorarchaeota archaeon]
MPIRQKDNDAFDEAEAVPFTARLIAYQRAQEYKREDPLISDPFAERLAGDLEDYLSKHKRYTRMDYPIIRAYYLENELLAPWCKDHSKSQIVLLGAGFDTRAYRFTPLNEGNHTVFEIDFPIVIDYKDEIMYNEEPLCNIVRTPADLSIPSWKSQLIDGGFSSKIPTFWILEGTGYYLPREAFVSVLETAATMSPEDSEIFVDVCVRALAEVSFGAFMMHFKWGINPEGIQPLFAENGWSVNYSFADDHDRGRDVGQKGHLFVHGDRFSG